MKIFIVLLLFFCVLSANAQLFIPVDDGSNVKFKIKNFGVMVEGTFKGLNGKIQFDKANMEVIGTKKDAYKKQKRLVIR